MRIGVDVRELRRGVMTGIGRYLHNFLSYAGGHASQHELILYGNPSTGFELPGRNMRLKVLASPFTLWWDQVTVAREARRDDLNIFFSPYVKGPAYVSCPYVTTIHDLLFYIAPVYRGLKDVIYQRLFKAQGQFISKRAAAIVAVSEHSKRDIVKIFGVSEDKIVVIPNCVSDRYRPVEDASKTSALKRQLGIRGNYVLYVGNFKPHKNVASLVRAFAQVSPLLRRDWQLVLAGRRDAFGDDLRRLAEEVGVGRDVLFTDFVTEDEMPTLYSGATLFVFPSLYEGFGLPVLEAMACGVPVISANTSSLPEVLGNAGLLVHTDAEQLSVAMSELMPSESRRRELSRLGLARAKEFSLERTGRAILDLLERLVNEDAACN